MSLMDCRLYLMNCLQVYKKWKGKKKNSLPCDLGLGGISYIVLYIAPCALNLQDSVFFFPHFPHASCSDGKDAADFRFTSTSQLQKT